MEDPGVVEVRPASKAEEAPRGSVTARGRPPRTAPAAVLWPVALALVAPFALTVWASQLESWGDDEAALFLGMAAVVAVVVLVPLGAVAGALAARLEGLTEPQLPRRGDWVRLGATRTTWLAGLAGLPWSLFHLLGVFDSYRAENHVFSVVAALVAFGPLFAFVLLDRRISRRLASRVPEPGGTGSQLDRVPSAVWVGLLAAVLLGGPASIAATGAVAEPGARVAVLLGWAICTALAAAMAGGLRAALPGVPGARGPAAARAGAAILLAGWLWPYLLTTSGGAGLFGGQSHGGRLVVACLSAAVLLVPVAMLAWAREARRASAG